MPLTNAGRTERQFYRNRADKRHCGTQEVTEHRIPAVRDAACRLSLHSGPSTAKIPVPTQVAAAAAIPSLASGTCVSTVESGLFGSGNLLSDPSFQLGRERKRINRLGDIAVHACLQTFFAVAGHGMRSHGDDGDVPIEN